MTKSNDKKKRRGNIKEIKHQNGTSRITAGKKTDDRKIPHRKTEPVARLKVRKMATLSEVYATYRKQFTAADLQRYTEIEPMVPAEQLLAELEAIDREETRKRMKKS